MDIALQVVHITLVSIAKAVFNVTFIIVMFIIYFLIRKLQLANIYNIENSQSSISQLIEVSLQGTIVGIIGSLIIVAVGIPVHFTIYLSLLLPISLVLSLINVRYICFSYSAAIMGILALIFNGQTIFGITLPNINISITGLIALVGVLHLMESLLIYFNGANNCIPIISKMNNQVIQGHILQKYWPIPISVLFVTTGYVTGESIQMPDWWPILKNPAYMATPLYYGLISLVGALGYSSVTFTEEPEIRSKKTAKMLFVYSLGILIIAIIAKENKLLQLFGLFTMSIMHEGIILIEQKQERKKDPIYTLPKKGVRIMYTLEGSVAEKIGLKRGDIIKKINDIEILNKEHFKEIMNKKFTFLWIEIQNLKDEYKVYEYKAYPNGIDYLGVKILPENPRIFFNINQVEEIGIYQLIKKRIHKK